MAETISRAIVGKGFGEKPLDALHVGKAQEGRGFIRSINRLFSQDGTVEFVRRPELGSVPGFFRFFEKVHVFSLLWITRVIIPAGKGSGKCPSLLFQCTKMDVDLKISNHRSASNPAFEHLPVGTILALANRSVPRLSGRVISIRRRK
jgi:hypothetical protein